MSITRLEEIARRRGCDDFKIPEARHAWKHLLVFLAAQTVLVREPATIDIFGRIRRRKLISLGCLSEGERALSDAVKVFDDQKVEELAKLYSRGEYTGLDVYLDCFLWTFGINPALRETESDDVQCLAQFLLRNYGRILFPRTLLGDEVTASLQFQEMLQVVTPVFTELEVRLNLAYEFSLPLILRMHLQDLSPRVREGYGNFVQIIRDFLDEKRTRMEGADGRLLLRYDTYRYLEVLTPEEWSDFFSEPMEGF